MGCRSSKTCHFFFGVNNKSRGFVSQNLYLLFLFFFLKNIGFVGKYQCIYVHTVYHKREKCLIGQQWKGEPHSHIRVLCTISHPLPGFNRLGCCQTERTHGWLSKRNGQILFHYFIWAFHCYIFATDTAMLENNNRSRICTQQGGDSSLKWTMHTKGHLDKFSEM